MSLETFPSCIGAFFLDSTGVSGSTLVDQTAYCNDLALLTGAITYSTRDGQEVMDFDNSYWFEGPNLLIPGGSVVFVGVCDAPGADGSLMVLNTLSRKANPANWDGVPNNAVDADWHASIYARKALYFNTNIPRIFDRTTGVNSAGTAFTAGAMNIFTGGVSIEPARTEGSTGTQGVQTSNFAAAASASTVGSHMRVGHLKASGGITAGKYLSGKRLYFFNENVFNNSAFAAARAAEMALWGI